jgi:hypothetical protein
MRRGSAPPVLLGNLRSMPDAVSKENVSARLAEIRGQLKLLADYL